MPWNKHLYRNDVDNNSVVREASWMRLLSDLLRFDDWNRLPRLESVPLLFFWGMGIFTNIVLIIAAWPTAPWRLLIALTVGTGAACVSHWVLRRTTKDVANGEAGNG